MPESSTNTPERGEHRSRIPRRRTIVLVGVGIVALLWILPWLIEAIDLGDGPPELDLAAIDRP